MTGKLPKSLRQKNRYIVYEIITGSVFQRPPVVQAIQSNHLKLYGEIGAAKHNMWVMDFNPDTKRGIVKTTAQSKDEVVSSIALVTQIDRTSCSITTLKTFGTLKQARMLLEKN